MRDIPLPSCIFFGDLHFDESKKYAFTRNKKLQLRLKI